MGPTYLVCMVEPKVLSCTLHTSPIFQAQSSFMRYKLPDACSILSSAIFIFLLALVGVFYPYNRGALFTALVVIYALTSGIAGYTATSMYLQFEGTNWVWIYFFPIMFSLNYVSQCATHAQYNKEKRSDTLEYLFLYRYVYLIFQFSLYYYYYYLFTSFFLFCR